VEKITLISLNALKHNEVVLPWRSGQRSVKFEETLVVAHGCCDSASRTLCERLWSSVIVGIRPRTLVRKKYVEHAQKNLTQTSVFQRLNFKCWRTFNVRRALCTFVYRYYTVTQFKSLLGYYLSFALQWTTYWQLTGDLSTTTERFSSAQNVLLIKGKWTSFWHPLRVIWRHLSVSWTSMHSFS
jgi:hypothetical protein